MKIWVLYVSVRGNLLFVLSLSRARVCLGKSIMRHNMYLVYTCIILTADVSAKLQHFLPSQCVKGSDFVRRGMWNMKTNE